jgi:carboxylesterase
VTPLGWLAVAAGAAFAVWVALVAFRGATIAVPAPAPARPTRSPHEALARLAELQSADDEGVAEACRTRLLEPSEPCAATIVVWHGFTNCPAQFAAVAERFAAAGYRVLLPRMPHHGARDVLTRELLELRAADLTGHVGVCVDIATGFGAPVWVVGLSAGGVLAAWAAATRDEVSRAVLSAPFVAPKAIPMQLVRLLVRFRSLIPGLYLWWDPRKKADLGESPYVYPGFPLPGMVPFLHLAEALYDRHLTPDHRLRRVVLTSNPGDFAIRRDVARSFTFRVFDGRAETLAELTLDAQLGWWHDFVDPYGPHVGPTDHVAEVFLAALGVADDPAAGGAIVPPLPVPDPAESEAP